VRPEGEAAPEPVAGGAKEASRAEAASLQIPKAAQDEFGFGELETRGYFERTDRNLFDGQDMDVPTYLRKGIRIVI
jgi:cell division protein FtsZ